MIGLVHLVTGSGLWGIGLLGETLTFALEQTQRLYCRIVAWM
jgi:hypothetical protein